MRNKIQDGRGVKPLSLLQNFCTYGGVGDGGGTHKGDCPENGKATGHYSEQGVGCGSGCGMGGINGKGMG